MAIVKRFLSSSISSSLQRHAPMIMSVCRALLPCEADAEDVFQSSVLIFARKAGSIRKQASVGSWLHGVAYGTARQARAELAKRRRHEARAARPESADGGDDGSWLDV